MMDDCEERVAPQALNPSLETDTSVAQIYPGVTCTLLNLQQTHSENDKAHYHSDLNNMTVNHSGSNMQGKMTNPTSTAGKLN